MEPTPRMKKWLTGIKLSVAVAVAYPISIIFGGVLLVYLSPPSPAKTEAFLTASPAVSAALLVAIFFVAVMYLDKARDKPPANREFMAWWFVLGLVVLSSALFVPTIGLLLGLDESQGPALITGTLMGWGFSIALLSFGILQLGLMPSTTTSVAAASPEHSPGSVPRGDEAGRERASDPTKKEDGPGN